MGGAWLIAGQSKRRKTTRLLRLDSFEFVEKSDLESERIDHEDLGWPGENEPWPIT